jgi:hypothetical protein
MTRRAVGRLLLTGAALAGILLASQGSAASVRGAAATDPATWKPWHLAAANQFRLAAPAGARSSTTKGEVAQLLRFQAKRTPAMLAAIKKWNGQPAVVPWSDALIEALMSYRPRPPAAGYDIAILYTGLYDAMIAASDSRDAYKSARPAPSSLDKRIKPAIAPDPGSSYAPSQAAIAGAAEVLLPYLFPDASPVIYTKMANEAVSSRLWAGISYRSDVEQARALGHKVAQLVIQQAQTDGRATNTAFPTPRPTGDPFWSSTPPGYEPPFGGPAGTWRPWLMTSNDQFVKSLPGPSQYGSPAYMDQLFAVLNAVKNETEQQKKIAFFWDDGPGTPTPPGHWIQIGEDLIKQYHPSNVVATRDMALEAAALADAGVEAWRVKYTYWSVRPITGIWRLCDGGQTLCSEAQVAADPSRATYRNKWYSPITTPSFPSYVSAHATFSGAASTVLAALFPAAADKVTAMAAEAAQSRVWGGIHYPEDSRDGLALGKMVGQLAIARAQTDGGL